MACPRLLLQSVNMCSRVCRAAAWTTRPNFTNVVRQSNLLSSRAQRVRKFSCTSAAANQGRLFSKDHEWLLPDEAKKTGTLGISDHAQAELGDIVFVDLPQVGTTLLKGETFGVVESVKAASDLYAMIDGEVIQVNDLLEQTPELVNQKPLEAGWMMKVKISNPGQLDDLMTEDEYQNFLSTSTED